MFGTDNEHAVNSTGGKEMPEHRHINNIGYSAGGETSSGLLTTNNGLTPSIIDGTWIMSTTGGNHPHNNMPPYLSVYIWMNWRTR